jgi:hypothetical protein
VTRDRDIAAIVLFLVCVGAFAYVAWSKPASAPYSGADATVYRESYRGCEKQWQERELDAELRHEATAAAWAGRYDDARRPAARAGCLDAVTGKPPKA